MKKQAFLFVFVVLFSCTTSLGFSQNYTQKITQQALPKWVSTIGYWVVESNVYVPRHHIVYLYNNDNMLVYKETLDGITLKLKKRKTKMQLKKLVDQTVLAYLQKQKGSEDEMLVMHQLCNR